MYALKQESKTRWWPRQRNLQLQNGATLISRRLRAVKVANLADFNPV